MPITVDSVNQQFLSSLIKQH